jgi:C4-dicarboxylate transporter, DctM subunit
MGELLMNESEPKSGTVNLNSLKGSDLDDRDVEHRGWMLVGGLIGAVLVLLYLILVPNFARETVGLLVLAMMLVMLFARIPVGIAMGLSGLLGVFSVGGWRPAYTALGQMPFGAVSSWSLSVIPMFIFMGLMVGAAGLTDRIYRATEAWLRWLPGGLAVTTNFAGAGLAAASGSTIGITYAVGRVSIPEMLRAGYEPKLAVGSVLMSGTGGQLIPPSIQMVVYAGVAGVAVGPQLMAGLLPGLFLTTILYTLLIVLWSVFRPPKVEAGYVEPKYTWAQRGRALARIWPMPLLIAVVLGGLYLGIFTATEAGAYGAFTAIVIAAIFLPLRAFIQGLQRAALETVSAVGAIFLMLIGAAILNRALTITGVARWATDAIVAAELSRWQLIVVLTVVYLLLGMVMEPLAMIILTVPILLPMVAAYEISLVWFGVFVVLLGEMAILTPPVGVLVFVLYKIVREREIATIREVQLKDLFSSVLIFLPATFLLIALMAAFPQAVEWLPSLVSRG